MNEVKEIYNLSREEENYCKNCRIMHNNPDSERCIHCSHAPFVPTSPIGDYYIPKGD